MALLSLTSQHFYVLKTMHSLIVWSKRYEKRVVGGGGAEIASFHYFVTDVALKRILMHSILFYWRITLTLGTLGNFAFVM